ncbi:MAG TPA: hypothetical protein VH765_02470 [Xanthobacteraceae bacterium]|jgi:hypothetical protein
MEPKNRREQRDLLDSEIDPITCIAFVLIVFLIIPFTLLSPFRYPQPSTLDKMLSVNGGDHAQRPPEARLYGQPVLDLSVAAVEGERSATRSVTR